MFFYYNNNSLVFLWDGRPVSDYLFEYPFRLCHGKWAAIPNARFGILF